jgi:hypothetical protein
MQFIQTLLFARIFVGIIVSIPLLLTIRSVLLKKQTKYFLYLTISTYFTFAGIFLATFNKYFVQGMIIFLVGSVLTSWTGKMYQIKKKDPKEKIDKSDLLVSEAKNVGGDLMQKVLHYAPRLIIFLISILVLAFIMSKFTK